VIQRTVGSLSWLEETTLAL